MPVAEPESTSGLAAGARASRRRAFSFPKSARIVSRADFEALYASAPKAAGRYVVVWAAPGKTGASRLGVAAAKRTFRDAHQRNRAKRLVRESFRQLRPSLRGGPLDVAVAARYRILSAKEGDVRADLARTLAKLPAAEAAPAGEERR